MNIPGVEGQINAYECNFFHMKVEDCDFCGSFAEMSVDHLGSFIHEYMHYLQQITTPFGLKYCDHFIQKYILYRDHIDKNNPVDLPLKLDADYSFVNFAEKILGARNGTVNYNKGRVDRVIVREEDIVDAERNKTAVNIGVIDNELGRKCDKGFDFGYTCVIESMAHMVQSLVNPEVAGMDQPLKYKAAQMICREYCPKMADDTKMLVSLCYTALYFDNPGAKFFTMIDYAHRHPEENGKEIYARFMRDHERCYKGEKMPAYRLMHGIIDEFTSHLSALIGHDLVYYQTVMDNCKREASKGESKLLEIIYNEDIGNNDSIEKLIVFFGLPCIDSMKPEPIVPSFSKEAMLETGCLLSMETLIKRFEERQGETECVRFARCQLMPYEDQRTSKECHDGCQWLKTEECLFTSGLKHWEWEDKQFVERPE